MVLKYHIQSDKIHSWEIGWNDLKVALQRIVSNLCHGQSRKGSYITKNDMVYWVICNCSQQSLTYWPPIHQKRTIE